MMVDFRLLKPCARALACRSAWPGLVLLAACGGQGAGSTDQDRTPVAPTEFAVEGCGHGEAVMPCALVHAGGKRVLFGAPSGAQRRLDTANVAYPDAVLLFDLQAGAVDGLDTIRNSSWQAGRTEPLLLVGPAGTRSLALGLDKAFEQSDALAYIETPPRGDFRAARIASVEVHRPRPVFDTGDLVVEAQPDGPSSLAYRVIYDGQVLYLSKCGVASWHLGEADAVLKDGACQSDRLMTWPLPGLPRRLDTPQARDLPELPRK